MKRTKISLGILALVFAIGSAFATKATRDITDVYYKDGGLCHLETIDTQCKDVGGGCTDLQARPIFKDGQDGQSETTCLNELKDPTK